MEGRMASLEIEQIPVLKDNYVYLVHEPQADRVGVVDPAVHEPVLRRLADKGWRLTHVINTHHHADHTGGNLALKAATGCQIVGPRADRDRIPGIDVEVGDGESWRFGAAEAQVFDVPGHTRGHIAYWFRDADALFCGDTLFALGCGRLFEGTPDQMWRSLSKLRSLPDATRVYCAHEYTQSNARFALTVERDNVALVERSKRIDGLRAKGVPTVPSTLGEERATNPFLRADQPGVARGIGLADADPVAVFAAVRLAKDRF
jgi:hydroxyacylglutathione hydrolase